MLGWLPGQDYLDTGEGRGSSKAPISSTPDPRLSHNVGHGQVRSRQAPSHGCSCSCAQCGAMAMVEPIAYKFWALWIWMQLKWAAWVCLLIWEPRIRLFSLEEATFFIAMWTSQRLQSSCPHRKGETPMFHDSVMKLSHAIPVAYDW